VAAALLAASTAYLLAKALGSPDGYDATLGTIARATSIATPSGPSFRTGS
jgi:hypothetical protein